MAYCQQEISSDIEIDVKITGNFENNSFLQQLIE